jgi:hypothetical protein
MVKPTIHRNGTSAEALLEGYLEAHRALLAALEGLEGAAPNARDYYPVPGSFEVARAQHARRIERVRSVLEEVMTLAEHVSEALP